MVFRLREQFKLLKEENENKTFIIKLYYKIKNDLSSMGTKVLLQQRTLQSFDENISEEIPWLIVFQKVNVQLKFIQKNN